MNYLTHQLLNAEEINFIEKELEQENQGWEDGKKTAGSHASIVKNNLQLKRTSDISKKLSSLVKQKILNDDLIKSFTLAKHVHGIMFTKSSEGMSYGRHIDNAYICLLYTSPSPRDLSTKKNLYEGGELLIENLTSENKFKLNSGEILIYPSTFLHSVQEVLNGERIVCVGWIESYIKSIEEREYLFDLDAGARSLLSKHGRSDDLDLIFKSYSNLLRVMGD